MRMITFERPRLDGLSARFLAAFQLWSRRRVQRRELLDLDDWLLRDIGITREQAELEAHKPLWMK